MRETLTPEESRALVQELVRLPGKLETILGHDAIYDELVKRLFRATDFLFLGRGVHFPIALEGALKLKEISYIHAEGYPAGEMKHGPNALIDENLPVIVLATQDKLYEKTLSNIQEVKAREGLVVAIVTEGDREVGKVADYVIEIPAAPDLLTPVLEIIPLQLLAYHIAVRRGCDVVGQLLGSCSQSLESGASRRRRVGRIRGGGGDEQLLRGAGHRFRRRHSHPRFLLRTGWI